MLGVAGTFQDEENTEQAHSVYLNTMLKPLRFARMRAG